MGIPLGPSTRTARYGLSQGLSDARAQSDALFAIIRPEAFYERPIAERHRIIFYLGHLEAFDWNLFSRELPGLKPFASGVRSALRFWNRSGERRPARRSTRGLAETRRGAPLCPEPAYIAERRTGERAGGVRRRTPANAFAIRERGHRASLDARGDAGVHAAPLAPQPQTLPAGYAASVARRKCGRI